jgi:hypothetical protein
MDLYDDLDFVEFALLPSTKPSSCVSQSNSESENVRVKNEVETLKRKLERLEIQNSILRKNISCLFKTARAELQRKDSIIHSQRNRMQAMEYKPRTSQEIQ